MFARKASVRRVATAGRVGRAMVVAPGARVVPVVRATGLPVVARPAAGVVHPVVARDSARAASLANHRALDAQHL